MQEGLILPVALITGHPTPRQGVGHHNSETKAAAIWGLVWKMVAAESGPHPRPRAGANATADGPGWRPGDWHNPATSRPDSWVSCQVPAILPGHKLLPLLAEVAAAHEQHATRRAQCRLSRGPSGQRRWLTNKSAASRRAGLPGTNGIVPQFPPREHSCVNGLIGSQVLVPGQLECSFAS